MKPSSKRILGVLLIVLSVLTLPLAFCQYLSSGGFYYLPCAGQQEISSDTRIAYCISLSPWESFGTRQMYAEGTTNQDDINVRDLHFRREAQILWVNNHPVQPHETYQTVRWRATLNPWLILTSRFEIKNEGRTSIGSNAPSNANVLYVSGEVYEGWLPNPLGLIMLGSGIWLRMQGERRKTRIR